MFVTSHTRSGQCIFTSCKHSDIGTPQKKEFYLCANTPVAARAWVATLRAVALVLKAQEEAFSSLSGIGHAKLGTMAALVAAANTTAQEAANDLQMSLKFPTASPSSPLAAGSMDNVGILKVWLTPLLNSFQMYF